MGRNDGPHSTTVLIISEVILAIFILIFIALFFLTLSKLFKQCQQHQFFSHLNKQDLARVNALYQKLGIKKPKAVNVKEMHKQLLAVKEDKDKCFALLINMKREHSDFGRFYKKDGGPLTKKILQEAGLGSRSLSLS